MLSNNAEYNKNHPQKEDASPVKHKKTKCMRKNYKGRHTMENGNDLIHQGKHCSGESCKSISTTTYE